LTKVIEQLPDDKTVYIERGLVFKDMGNHHFAIEDFQRAIEIDKSCILAYFYSGTSKLKSN
jgi:tetratricopeptide (TPR) repeat protein